MNNPQITAERIEMLAKSKNISVSTMLSELGMNKNALFTMKNSGYLPRIESLCKFANYFGVSVDYLIGRTNNPNIMMGINVTDNKHNITNSDNSININTTADQKTSELVSLIEELPIVKRAEAILYLNNLKNEQ